ncbi:hypothetical protein [Aestuariispira insulae]|uniref:Uncharacterized protein n=1 Tax=Aestuariispira insulae TaxID=1461337 RepID=A0A3D9HVI4_9PROT|nr:hypothetical protein [Aestuariispira insulae]RED53523.1 hypothetical protein DFP90_101314 [Aestuariispira insulae]
MTIEEASSGSEGEEARKKEKAWEHALRRDAMYDGAVKALLTLNGGGTVTLLAFLQAIWVKQSMTGLSAWVVIGMAFMAAGAAFAGIIPYLRYHTSMKYQNEGITAGRCWTKCCQRVTEISFGMFVVGIGTVIAGAFSNLPD